MRCRVVEFPEFELLHFLRMHVRPGAHNLAESNWFGTLVEVAHSHDFNEEHGLPELRETLAALHGVCVEQLLLTAGASEANFLLAAALLLPGDGCIVETPGYAPLRGFGAEPRELLRRPDEGFALDPQRFQSLLPARLAFVTNLHNPSGVRSDPALLRELGGVMAAGGGLLVVDEIFRPLAADLPTVAGAPGIAVTGSLSKCYGGTATRVGWVIAEPELVARLAALKQWTNPGAFPAGERAGLTSGGRARMRLQRRRAGAHGVRSAGIGVVRQRIDYRLSARRRRHTGAGSAARRGGRCRLPRRVLRDARAFTAGVGHPAAEAGSGAGGGARLNWSAGA